MAELSANHLNSLRQQMRTARRALDQSEQAHHARSLANQICRNRIFVNSHHLACYLANDGEIDPQLIIERAWKINKQVYLPVLSPFGQRLYFAPYRHDSRLCTNRFGIPEPDCHPRDWRSAQQLDLILLPLVAFDNTGNRLGMGGGFYDRSLAYRQSRQHWLKPRLFGLAHELQKTGQLETRSWDIPLDSIATEKCIYKIEG